MGKWSTVVPVMCFVASMYVASSATVASASAIPTCVPKQLLVVAGVVGGNTLVTSGRAEQWVDVDVVNLGDRCLIGGLPRITPTGVAVTIKPNSEAVDPIVESAIVSPTNFTMIDLTRGRSVHTYLAVVYEVGHSSKEKMWAKACRPLPATGMAFKVAIAKTFLKKRIKASIPNVCTSGKINNLSAVPLGTTSYY